MPFGKIFKGIGKIAKKVVKTATPFVKDFIVPGIGGGVQSGLESGIGNVINQYVSPPQTANTPFFNYSGAGAAQQHHNLASAGQEASEALATGQQEQQREQWEWKKYLDTENIKFRKEDMAMRREQNAMSNSIQLQELSNRAIEARFNRDIALESLKDRQSGVGNRLGSWFFGKNRWQNGLRGSKGTIRQGGQNNRDHEYLDALGIPERWQ